MVSDSSSGCSRALELDTLAHLLRFIIADMSEIWAGDERNEHGADVLNGISVSQDEDLLYITGKQWDRMFLVR